MINNLDPASELFLSNVERIQGRIASATRQISSGKKIAQPSDAPDQIDSILQLRADQQRNAQIRSNLGYELTYIQNADQALSSAIKLVENARVLANTGANKDVNGANTTTLAADAQTLMDQMLALSQTTVQGRYIFGGDQDTAPSYQADATSPTGVVRLSTAPATRRIEDGAGGSFAAGKSAVEIFDSRNADDTLATDNVFAALAALRDALLGGDPQTIAGTQSVLGKAADRLNSTQAFYGNVQNRVNSGVDFTDKNDIELQKQLSQKEDADIVAAALEITMGNTQLQAAFQTRAMAPRKSLFEYL